MNDLPDWLVLENRVVLMVVQALLGSISPKMTAVAVDVSPDLVTLYFWVKNIDASIKEDVDDAMAELDAIFDNKDPKRLECVIEQGNPPADWVDKKIRMVFREK